MCYALYIGTDTPQEVELAGDAEDRFFLRALSGQDDVSVVDKFSKPHIYFAASWEGCGCGWFKDVSIFSGKRERMRVEELTRSSLRDLRESIRAQLDLGHTVELYLTWEGEQSKPVKRRFELALSDLGEDKLALELGDLAVISEAPPR